MASIAHTHYSYRTQKCPNSTLISNVELNKTGDVLRTQDWYAEICSNAINDSNKNGKT